MIWRWLRDTLGGEVAKTATAAVPGPITKATVARQIEVLLARQFADADAKLQAGNHWGDTGMIVRRAATDCRAILQPWPDHETVPVFFSRVLPALAALADRYREDGYDADGYGLGTVREVEEAVWVMARVVGLEQPVAVAARRART